MFGGFPHSNDLFRYWATIHSLDFASPYGSGVVAVLYLGTWWITNPNNAPFSGEILKIYYTCVSSLIAAKWVPCSDPCISFWEGGVWDNREFTQLLPSKYAAIFRQQCGAPSSPRTRCKHTKSRPEMILLSCISPKNKMQIQVLHMNKQKRYPNAQCIWYIYLHLPYKFQPHVGKYAMHWDHWVSRI